MVSSGQPLVVHAFQLCEPAIDEVVIEVAGCGVCHTDLGFAFDGIPTRHPLPLVLGHEIAGRVVAAGQQAAKWLIVGQSINKLIGRFFIPMKDCAVKIRKITGC